MTGELTRDNSHNTRIVTTVAAPKMEAVQLSGKIVSRILAED